MTYSLTLASTVPATSAFVVRVNSTTRNVTAVAVSGTKVTLTLASSVVAGDVVTVAYTKPSANPLQTAAGGQAISFTAQNVINNCQTVSNQPPFIDIASPTKNTSYVAPATVTIEATAYDTDGSIISVEFYNSQVKLGETTSAPYSFAWKDVPAGSYILTAVAVDNLNARTVSSSVTVVVEKSAQSTNQYPNIKIKSPNKGRNYTKNEVILLEAEASDTDGAVRKVAFKIGEITLTELTEAPYIFEWKDADTGTYNITAIAVDDLGAISQSEEIKISVLLEKESPRISNLYPNPTDGPVTVEMSMPAEGKMRYIIYSLTGRQLYSEEREGDEQSADFNISSMPAGTYLISVIYRNGIVDSRKITRK